MEGARSPEPGRVRAPLVSIGAAAAAVLATLAPEALELSREGVARGELWRIWTGQLAHCSLYHLGVDAGTLLALGFLYERAVGPARWALILGIAAPVIAGAFLLLEPGLKAYRGLSGIDCAAFAVAVGVEARRRPALGLALGGLFAAKLAWEQASGSFLFPAAGLGDMGLPVLSAHAAGALAGFAAALTFSSSWSARRPSRAAARSCPARRRRAPGPC